MTTIYLNPPVGTKGVIKLSPPFTTAVVENTPYRIAAVRTLTDINASGTDPFATYYDPAGITQEKYEQDLLDNVCILSLQSSSGEWVYVPNSYLLQMPLGGGVAYTGYVVGVNLGALPNTLDLTYFNSRVQALAYDLLGVSDAVVKTVTASATTFLSQEDSATIEAARSAVMSIVKTDYAKLQESEAARLSAISRIAELEAYIIALNA